MTARGHVPPWSTPELARALGLPPDTDPREVVARGVHELGATKTCELLETPFAFWLETAEGDLVAARDGFGGAPLAWARGDDGRVALSNEVESLAGGRAVDLGTVADFARFGWMPRVERTFFEGVSMVPAGHTLVAHGGRAERVELAPFAVARAVPVPRREDEVVAEFWSRFGDACVRLSENQRVAVSLSGGLDSTLVAAALQERGVDVFAVTASYSVHDEEFPLTRAVARHLELELHVVHADRLPLFGGWDGPGPAGRPREDWIPIRQRLAETAREHGARALFLGTGADPLLQTPDDLGPSIARRGLGGLLALARGWALHGIRPNLRTRTTRGEPAPIPDWLSAEVRAAAEPPPGDEELNLHVRRLRSEEGLRLDALAACTNGSWPRGLEVLWDQRGFYRQPFFSRAVCDYVLSLPHLPWAAGKELLRAAARGRLPDAVRARRKTPLARRHGEERRAPEGMAALRGDLARSARILDLERLGPLDDTDSVESLYARWCALSLANWWSKREGQKA